MGCDRYLLLDLAGAQVAPIPRSVSKFQNSDSDRENSDSFFKNCVAVASTVSERSATEKRTPIDGFAVVDNAG